MSALGDFLGSETQAELQIEIKNVIIELIRDEYARHRVDLLAWCDFSELCDDILQEVCEEVKDEMKKSVKSILKKEMNAILKKKAVSICEEEQNEED